MNTQSKMISLIYSFCLIVGGVMGFVQAHSKISLISGLITGVLVFISYRMGDKNPKSAYLYVTAISLCLTFFFLTKYFSSHVFMPHGLMLLLSATTFVVNGLSFLKNK